MKTRAEAKREKARADLENWAIETPNDPINEQTILAAMAIDEDVRKRLVKKLSPEHFFAEKHKAIFSALGELESRGLAYDPAVLARFAPSVDIRIVEQISEARSEIPANLEHHVDTLLWDNKRAEVSEGPLASFIGAIQDAKSEPARLRSLARSVGEAFEDVRSKAPFLRKRKGVVSEMMATLRRRTEGEAFYPFGVDKLDYTETGERRVRPGAAPGQITILTGMSGSGKTTFAGHLILGLARQRRRVAVGAWEVRAPMTLELITTLSLRWSRSKVLDGRLTKEELALFEERANLISPYVRFIENPFRRGSVRKAGKVTNDDYLDILEEHIEASGAEVVVLDLFDRVLRYRKPDDEQEALWRMHEMTTEKQIHSVLVHQQLIKGEGVRRDKKPSLQGLKGSSAYVDVGTTILAPHIPARWKNVEDDKFHVYGLKQRFANPFGVEFDWNPDTGQIWGGNDIGIDEGSFEDEIEGSRDGTRIPGVAAPKRRR